MTQLNGMSESITALRAKQTLSMTKTFSASGVKPYDNAKFFEVKTFEASDIRGLSAKLVKLEKEPRCCIIRGAFKGLEHAETIEGMFEDKTGLVARKKKLFDDVPRHALMIDVDNFEPIGLSPCTEPAKAVAMYIEEYLPECFQNVTHHWQLSASVGTPGKEHILKVHIWFWLETAYTSPQLTAWAKVTSKAIDVSPLRVIQPHFTADPIFMDGLVDPVPVRSGLAEGFMGDTVHLRIDDALMLRAMDYTGEDDDYEFVNPSKKPGVIGAFHRAFTVEEVFTEFLPNEFEFEPGNERRANWLKGGGTPGGVFVTDDRMHVGSTHNTDPFDNRIVNLFDLVRHYKYGHLDDGMDAFELLDMWARPSYQAAITELSALPEVVKELEAEQVADQRDAVSLRDRLAQRIRSAKSETGLRSDVCLDIQRKFRNLDSADVTILAKAVQAKYKELGLDTIVINDARALITPPKKALQPDVGVPDWAKDYVYVTSMSQLFRYDSQEWLDRTSCEFKHNWEAGVDIDGNQISAFNVLRDLRALAKVEQALYMPHLEPLFTLNGVTCVNTYRPSSVPIGKHEVDWSDADRKAVRIASCHIEIICNDRSAVIREFMDWLAFCVQNPGIKIGYAWLIVGGEGVGKTWFGNLMSVALGGPNVGVVAGQEVVSGFSRWAKGYAFNVVEEVRMESDKAKASACWDALKAPLSNEHVVVILKGENGKQTPNVTNYLLLSNHDDAVPLSMDGRRVGMIKTPFYGVDTANQLQDMALREGYSSAEAYFVALFGALRDHPEVFREWLATWPITASFNPHSRAPMTDERESVVLSNRNSEEVAIRDAIDDGSSGVSKSVVCPGLLRLWLEFNANCLLTENMITEHLKSLGFRPSGLRVKWRVNGEGKTYRPWIRGVKLLPGSAHDDANKVTLRKLLDESVTKKDSSSEDSFLEQGDTKA